MNVNKILFWIISFAISLLSCYSYPQSSLQLYDDSGYVQSLNLSPYADTLTIALAGVVMLTYASVVTHIILLTALFILAYIKRKQITISIIEVVFTLLIVWYAWNWPVVNEHPR